VRSCSILRTSSEVQASEVRPSHRSCGRSGTPKPESASESTPMNVPDGPNGRTSPEGRSGPVGGLGVHDLEAEPQKLGRAPRIPAIPGQTRKLHVAGSRHASGVTHVRGRTGVGAITAGQRLSTRRRSPPRPRPPFEAESVMPRPWARKHRLGQDTLGNASRNAAQFVSAST